MKILVADDSDIPELTRVEIESKIHSIPECIEAFEIDPNSRASRWRTYFDGQSPQTSKPQRVVFKAIYQDSIVGYLAGHLTTRYNMDAEIQSFYVLKMHQRNGIGSYLLSEFAGWVIANECKSLCVGIAANNKYQAFYLKHGGKHLNEHWIYWNDVRPLIYPA